MSEDTFEYLMTIYDLIFPIKYHNIRVETRSNTYLYAISPAVRKISENP